MCCHFQGRQRNYIGILQPCDRRLSYNLEGLKYISLNKDCFIGPTSCTFAFDEPKLTCLRLYGSVASTRLSLVSLASLAIHSTKERHQRIGELVCTMLIGLPLENALRCRWKISSDQQIKSYSTRSYTLQPCVCAFRSIAV